MTIYGAISRADYMQGTRMSFSSKEAAIRFAEEQGLFQANSSFISNHIRIRLGLLFVSVKFGLRNESDFFPYRQTPMVKKIPPKNYAENYAYNPKELRIMKTK